MKKINWKVRFKNKVWLASFISLIIGFVFSILRMFDVYPKVTENEIAIAIDNLLTFLGMIGVLIDPTTEGMFDSQRALSYEKPWVDEPESEEKPEEDTPEEE